MFRVRRTTTVVAAAAGASAVAAVVAGDEPAPVPAPIPEAADAGAQHVVEQKPRGFTVLRVRRGRGAKLRDKPHGKVVARVGARTEFGSPQTLAVVERRGRWAGVTIPQRPNGRLAWVEEHSRAFERARTRASLHIDLSQRTMTFRQGRTRRSASIGIGAAGSPTPTGRFAITDKLRGSRFNRSAYGCCILALSGRQERTPPGWTGGDRLAIHGSSAPSGFTGSTAGCVRAEPRALKLLMRNVPLGTPVFVRH